jgi:hypothetical protein
VNLDEESAVNSEGIVDGIRALLGRIEEEPKTLGWNMRAKIGDRKRWHDLPEEADGGP